MRRSLVTKVIREKPWQFVLNKNRQTGPQFTAQNQRLAQHRINQTIKPR